VLFDLLGSARRVAVEGWLRPKPGKKGLVPIFSVNEITSAQVQSNAPALYHRANQGHEDLHIVASNVGALMGASNASETIRALNVSRGMLQEEMQIQI
jgi:hypothetical protein